MSHNLEPKIPDNYDGYKQLGFFNSDYHFFYVFKKTEKIAQAVYLITDHIKDSEPVKIRLKEESLDLLEISLGLNSIDIVEKKSLVNSFFSTIMGLTSFINIASISGLISRNNIDIISLEINKLVEYMKENIDTDLYKKGLILSSDFFSVDSAFPDKGRLSIKPKTHSPQTNTAPSTERDSIKVTKNTRQKNIMDLLKKESDLTIKDFVKVIDNCSEKTIQRELLSLVEKGMIKKDGERRWSRYSLK